MLFFLINGETAEFGAVQDNYTKEHRHATEALLRGFVADIVDGIAAARGLDPKQVRAWPPHRREPSRFIDCISHTPAPGVSWLCLIFPWPETQHWVVLHLSQANVHGQIMDVPGHALVV